MFLQLSEITPATFVTNIVLNNYRTADIFRKYDIDYCCGGGWPLAAVCMMKGLDFEQLKTELEMAGRTLQLPHFLPVKTWDVDFLTSYIVHVHHHYLKYSLPDTGEIVKHFAEGHVQKYPYMGQVVILVGQLIQEILPHMLQEEETIFPYICQVVHAYENNDSYAKLLVKTLRKPLDTMMDKEQQMLSAIIIKIRELTSNYTPPEKACVSQRVLLARLMELDNDLMQHIYLENEILFPKAIQIEKELLK